MMNPNLAYDEGILLESEENGVVWVTGSETQLQKLILSNKNIYLAFRKKISMFKSTDELIARPLADIKFFDGKPLVKQVKTDLRGICLQIQFFQGSELFSFYGSDKRETAKWVNALYKILVGTEAPAEAFVQKTGVLENLGLGSLGGLGEIAASLKNAASSAIQSAKGQPQRNTQDQVYTQPQQQQYVAPPQPIPVMPKPTGGFCSNCGGRLDAGARFCPGCGTPVSGVAPVVQTQPSVPVTTTMPPVSVVTTPPPVPAAPVNPETRQQQFAGVIVKCPNCGQPISNIDVICPSCGYQITGRAASNSVQRLQAELMAVENSRKEITGLGILKKMLDGEGEEEIICKKKATLIGSFPIPNTIEEIAEFVILAASNINVSLSKASLGNRFGRTGNDFKAGERGISDAWVGKLQQAYQKAELMFSDKPAFEKIKDIYLRKMKELK